MRVAYLDLETFWSATHTLTKLNPVAYCMHRETEIQSLAYAFDGGPVEVLFGEADIRKFIAATDWSDCLVIGHNMSQFDSMILAWRLGLRPKAWGCTLAMARPVYAASLGKLSLSGLCDALNLGVKGNLEAVGTKGRELASFTAAERVAMAKYNAQDVELCRHLFKHLVKFTPARELMVIDLTIRMLLAPKLRVDTALLQDTLDQERRRKVDAIDALKEKLGLPPFADLKKQLMSQPQFADLLRSLGVEPPTKISPTTGKETYAFAKDDEGLTALLEHDDPLVVSAVETRLGVKSSMLETRIETFLTVAEATGGRMPIALNYWGASTGRWSGCLVADTEVLVYTRRHIVTTKRIVDVLPDDLVWDGEEFVEHSGVVFSGYAEVISWDGVTGTKDHVVFTEVGEISLSEAMQGGHRITPAGRAEVHHVDAARKSVLADERSAARSVRLRV